jgi:hypothetical protein
MGTRRQNGRGKKSPIVVWIEKWREWLHIVRNCHWADNRRTSLLDRRHELYITRLRYVNYKLRIKRSTFNEHEYEIYEKLIWIMKASRNKLRDWNIDILFLILVSDTLTFDWYALLRYYMIIQYAYLHFNVTAREWEDQYKQLEWLFISYPLI